MGGDYINYQLLYDGDISDVDIQSLIATNRGLPEDWCKRSFDKCPSFDFIGLQSACNAFLHHLKFAQIHNTDVFKQKFQIIVDSDFDGICSAAIITKFLNRFYPYVETVFSMHTGKQHGLSKDIKIDDDTTLVIIPDAGSNDVEQCHVLRNKTVDVICLDHHIIENINPYAYVVNCMDGYYPNHNLCGAAVTWLFLYGFIINHVKSHHNKMHNFLFDMLDLVATATISDIMDVTNEDNMFFIQHGLKEIHSHALIAFLKAQEISLDSVTVEHIKFKVSPLVSAMIRIGNAEEKALLFRAFIDDYEEFLYEKRGSFDVENENIYDRVARFCKNAKGRQDRAKQKLLEECQVHEYPHILLVEYQDKKYSSLTGLVANELAEKYCKPCICYRLDHCIENDLDTLTYAGSIRNYDGSPIVSFKQLLDDALGDTAITQGHDNAAGTRFIVGYHELAELLEDSLPKDVFERIGYKQYKVDFEINVEDVNAGFIMRMSQFDNYSGHGFPQVIALVHDIEVSLDNFKTMGRTSLNWKISENGVDYAKFRLPKDDILIAKLDDISWDLESQNTNCYTIDAICTFGINVYNGEIHPQAIVKDYVITGTKTKTEIEEEDDFDLDML